MIHIEGEEDRMSQDELFDIFNEHMVKIGEDTRENVHRTGRKLCIHEVIRGIYEF